MHGRAAPRDLDRQGGRRRPAPADGVLVSVLVAEGKTVAIELYIARIRTAETAPASTPIQRTPRCEEGRGNHCSGAGGATWDPDGRGGIVPVAGRAPPRRADTTLIPETDRLGAGGPGDARRRARGIGSGRRAGDAAKRTRTSSTSSSRRCTTRSPGTGHKNWPAIHTRGRRRMDYQAMADPRERGFTWLPRLAFIMGGGRTLSPSSRSSTPGWRATASFDPHQRPPRHRRGPPSRAWWSRWCAARTACASRRWPSHRRAVGNGRLDRSRRTTWPGHASPSPARRPVRLCCGPIIQPAAGGHSLHGRR